MAPAMMMENVCVKMDISEVTAPVNFILLHSKFEVNVTASILYSSFIVACQAAINCSGHGTCRLDGTCECDTQFFSADCTSNL